MRESTCIREAVVGGGGLALGDWAVAIRSSRLEELARDLAEREGYDLDSEPALEAFEEAIKDCVFDAVDELIFQLRLYADRGELNDFADEVRQRADELLREWAWGKAGSKAAVEAVA